MATEESDPPGGDSGPRLETVGDVQREMAKVYRSMRMGRLDIPSGNGLTQTLQYLAKVTESVQELAAMARLERLERKREQQAGVDPQAH